MKSLRGLANVAMLAVSLMMTPRSSESQNVDTTLARIERLVVAGDRSSARHLADSLIALLPPESPRLADALYWRAQSAPSAADAERDYLRVSVEHPFASRAPDALMALAQLELARGDRSTARRRFDMLLRDYPSGKHLPRASLWSGRLALEDGDYAGGCARLNAARPLIGAGDVELRNQFDYFISQCDRILIADSVAAVESPATGAPAPATTTGKQYSVQVAAFKTRRDATSLASRLTARGLEARVVGDRAPYRVRVGRYATHADAVAALTRMRASKVNGIVVEAEPK